MSSSEKGAQPTAQAGGTREAGQVAGEPSGGGSRETDCRRQPEGCVARSAKLQLGVLSFGFAQDGRRSVDLWESITHGEPREGTCVEALKRSDGVVTAGIPATSAAKPPESSTLALTGRRKPTGERHPESRVRENRLHGLTRGRAR